MDAATALRPLIRRLAGGAPIRFELWDGSALGQAESPATVRFRSVRALQRLLLLELDDPKDRQVVFHVFGE